jgi:hypothetical protein
MWGNRQMKNHPWCAPAALIALALAGMARGEDLPLSVLLDIPYSAGIVQAPSGHSYAWIDASYQSANIPAVNPGQSAALSIVAPSYTPLRATDPFPNGVGMRSAIGVIMPGDVVAFGADARVELATSYANVGALMAAAPLDTGGPQLFGGANSLNGCAAIINCLPAATSPVSYQTFEADLRAASDFHLGALTATPSLTLFTRDARGQQSFYGATGSSSWSEWGARLGLETTLALDPRQSIGFRANAGSAYRAASFASNEVDFADPGNAPIVAAGHWNGVPFTGSAEASYLLRPAAGYLLRAFVGIAYDSHTPVSSESLGLDPTAIGAISSQALTSYYYGIGLKVHFAASGS